ncbi:MAG TPA: response regulator transcription factor [Candidatus Omnitrophota bacterium]|nr:response regulator transcription factor [Candidatus Omnitrophota bacterium]
MALKKILIVDDSDDFRVMLKEYLRKHNLGLEIFEASTAEMGVAKASCIRPDIVLMDINLPHSSGLEATKHIKGEFPDCDVIILTMFEVKVFKEAAMGIKATDFIGKSEIDERLVPAIKRCLDSKNGNKKH